MYKKIQRLVWKLASPERALAFNKQFVCYEAIPKHYRDLNLVFVHIPKAAGMSVVKTIYGKDQSSHYMFADYIKMDCEFVKGAISFAVTREPISRFCSAYYYLKSDGKSEIDRYWNRKYLRNFSDINDFVDRGLGTALKNRVEHFIPQWEFLFHEEFGVDYIFKIENSEDLQDTLGTLTGKNFNLSRINQSQYETELNESSISKLRAIYERDFTACGYE